MRYLLAYALWGIIVFALADACIDEINDRAQRGSYDCTTDTDCMQKYPCGQWYGNDIYNDAEEIACKEMMNPIVDDDRFPNCRLGYPCEYCHIRTDYQDYR